MPEFLRNFYWLLRNWWHKPPNTDVIVSELQRKQNDQEEFDTKRNKELNRFDEKFSRKKGACLIIVPGQRSGCVMTNEKFCTEKGDELRIYGGHTIFDKDATECPEIN